MTAYTIQISEVQRVFIVQALQQKNFLEPLKQKELRKKSIAEIEIESLASMFEDLPNQHDESKPNMLHGFCL